METSRHSMGQSIGEQLTLLPEDSRASRSVQQEKEKAQAMIATSGLKCLGSFERSPRAGLWAKTFAALLIGQGDWYSSRCALTWKLKGTKSNRLYFQLVPLVRHIGEKEYGLWPTSTSVQRDHPERVQGLLNKGATTMMSRKNGENRPNSVLDAAMFYGMLPTPTLADSKNVGRNGSHQENLHKITDLHLNPEFVEEMMGFPIGWTDLKHLETQ